MQLPQSSPRWQRCMQSAAEFRDWLEAPIDGNVASCEALLDRLPEP